MISISILLTILLIHFLADFGLQTSDQAVLKSSCNKQLANHVGVYSFIWLIAMIGPLGVYAVPFALLTFAAHFITDYFTSRQVKKYFDKNDYHNGFVVIGFDQLLHYLQLIGLYLTLK